MKVTKEDLPQQEVLLNIEVEPEDLAPYMERAYRRAVQRVNVPGFRKGKAPRAILERFVGHEALLDEAVDTLIPEVVDRAVQEEQLERGGIPSVEVVQKAPVVLKATVPLVPKVALNAYRDIRVPSEPVEVTEEEVQQTLERLRSELALWEPVERPIAEDDQVTMDVRGMAGTREAVNQKGVSYRVLSQNLNPVPGFAQALVGMEPGQPKEFTLPVPEEYPDRRLAGQDCTFHVIVHQVKERRPPELNDEFARGVGEGYDSLEALKEKVRGDIRLQKEAEARRTYEDKVMEDLLARSSLELSPLLVEHEVAHVLQDEEDLLKRQRVSVDEYLQQVGRSAEEHQEEARATATRRLTRSYALLKVAELEGLKETPEEVEQELQGLLDSAGPQAGALRRNFDTPEGRDSLARLVLNRKVMDRLVAIARGEDPNAGMSTASGVTEGESPGGTQDAVSTG